MKLFFGGDLNTQEVQNKLLFNGALDKLFREVDYRIINLEGPFIQENSNKFDKKGPAIHQSREFANQIENWPSTIFSLANNHILDYGHEGLNLTQNRLESCGHTHFGAGDFEAAYKPLILEENGYKVALFSACEAQFGALQRKSQKTGFAWINNPNFNSTISKIKKEVDYVVLVAHAGLEMYDLPQFEWQKIYHSFCDHGVDLVVGHHPHVIQGCEKYKASRIYYSLGNFCFGSEKRTGDKPWNQSLGLTVNLSKSAVSIDHHILEYDHSNLSLNLTEVNSSTIITELSDRITAKEFEHSADNIALEVYNKVYKNYVGNLIFHSPNHSNLSRKILMRLARKYFIHNDEMMLLHNVQIESHRFAIQRALQLKLDAY